MKPEDLRYPPCEEMQQVNRIQRSGHTHHCACRQVWGDGECECNGPLILRWSSDPPREKGWYRFRSRAWNSIVVQVRMPPFYEIGLEQYRFGEQAGEEWAGPIPEPEEGVR